MAKRICFAVEDVNFRGGAHVATSMLVRALSERGLDVSVLTLTEPTGEARGRFPAKEIRVMPCPRRGLRKLVRGLLNHAGLHACPDWTLDPTGAFQRWLAAQDVVCCVGEPSLLRQMVSHLPDAVRKVMLIHTDYVHWSRMSASNRRRTRWDPIWYGRYDAIGVVGTANAERMAAQMPRLADRIRPFHNLMAQTSGGHVGHGEDGDVRIVTLSRIEGPPKKTDRYLRVAKRLKDRGVRFRWTVYGDGPLLDGLRAMARSMGIDDVFDLAGYSAGAKGAFAASDLTVLLSTFEGLPNTVYESLMSGTPVFSTDVGGISEQVVEGETGWLVADDEERIAQRLEAVVSRPEMIRAMSDRLVGYRYDNERALREQMSLLGLETE